MKNSIDRFRYSIIALLMIVLNGAEAFASAPWTVDPADYRYDMSLYLDVTFASVGMDYSRYDVAAFAGDECRGVAEVLSLGNGKECLYLRVRSNQESGEKMTFRYYNKETGEIEPIDGVEFTFESNGRLGYPSDPYIVTIIRHFDVSLTAGTGGSVDKESGRYREGTELTVSAVPAEGYHFTEWSDGVTENPRTFTVAGNISVEARFEVNTYTLVYNVDGEKYREYEIAYGTDIVAEAAPEKEGYTFSGWDSVPATMPAHDVTVSGTFSINSYNAVFRIGEEVIETKAVVYGQPVVAPEGPAREGHTFAGWQNVPETMPAHDIEILGSYTVNTYKLTYVVDGATYKEYTVAYGTAVVAESAPEKEGYSFSGWDSVPTTMPAHDVTVSGTFSINSYNAVFRIGEEVIETKAVVFGQPVIAPEAPAREGHTFAGWQNVPETMPAHDIEILGSYTVNTYKLTYVVDGTTYKEYTVAYGTAVVAESAPEKEGYSFSGWDSVPATMPAHDVTVSGTFSINSYNAVFRIGEEVIETKAVVFGQPVVAPEAPAREGHTFAGWQNVPETMPAHDIEILGSYTVNTYMLTYIIDGDVYKTVEVEFGSEITAEEPEKEGYTFSGWDGLPETMPAHDVTVTGTFSINSYKLELYLNDRLYSSEMVEFGTKLDIKDPEVPENAKFDGWKEEIPETMPAHDVTLHGTYTELGAVGAIAADTKVTVVNVSGNVLYRDVPWSDIRDTLERGIYIINGKKYVLGM